MASLNDVRLHCIVVREPVEENEENTWGNVRKVRMKVITARGTRKMSERGELELVMDTPELIITNLKLIDTALSLKKYDILVVTGVLTSKAGDSVTVTCPECGHTMQDVSTTVYVTPTFIEKIGSVQDDEEMISYLTTFRHVSNDVTVMGRITSAPKRVMLKSDFLITQYQLALKRQLFITTDPRSVDIDYIWVKSYGVDGEGDWLALKEGSIVLIKGILQSRKHIQTMECECCHKEFSFQRRVTDIVPYGTEYISNYRSPEEQDKLREKQSYNSLKDKLGTIDTAPMDNTLEITQLIRSEEDIAADTTFTCNLVEATGVIRGLRQDHDGNTVVRLHVEEKNRAAELDFVLPQPELHDFSLESRVDIFGHFHGVSEQDENGTWKGSQHLVLDRIRNAKTEMELTMGIRGHYVRNFFIRGYLVGKVIYCYTRRPGYYHIMIETDSENGKIKMTYMPTKKNKIVPAPGDRIAVIVKMEDVSKEQEGTMIRYENVYVQDMVILNPAERKRK